MEYKQEIAQLLHKHAPLSVEELLSIISTPPDPKLGDYAFPCFKLGKNPHEEAEKIQKAIQLPSFLHKVQVAGPYLNFFVDKSQLTKETVSTVLKQKERYGHGKQKKNIVIEFCSPNTNKPLHLGHLRNIAIGDSLFRLLSFQGNKVHPVEIINDRGVHICKSMLAYARWGKNQQPQKKTDHFVGDYYVLFAQKAKENPSLEEEAQQMLLAWEKDDKKVQALWKKINQWAIQGIKQTYKRVGIRFEQEDRESQIYKKGKEMVQKGLQRTIFIQDKTGAIIAPLEKEGLTNKVVLRADGTSVYITQDLYLAEKRYYDFKFDQMLYVVASEQNLHFQQLFKILELLQKPYANKVYHLSYGLVNLPSGRMKSREGTVVDADDILDEISALAEKEVRQRYTRLPEKEIKRRAEFIALGALKFYLLRTDPARDMIYNPEESLSFEGETGPYLQYTHARACSILRKAKRQGKIEYTLLTQPQEDILVKLLAAFPQKVEETALQRKPHLLCRYVLDLAQVFNGYYHAFPVISENHKLMQARLALVQSIQITLQNALRLFGMEAPEEM